MCLNTLNIQSIFMDLAFTIRRTESVGDDGSHAGQTLQRGKGGGARAGEGEGEDAPKDKGEMVGRGGIELHHDAVDTASEG